MNICHGRNCCERLPVVHIVSVSELYPHTRSERSVPVLKALRKMTGRQAGR